MKIFFYFENFDVIVPFYHITIAYYNWKCYALGYRILMIWFWANCV